MCHRQTDRQTDEIAGCYRAVYDLACGRAIAAISLCCARVVKVTAAAAAVLWVRDWHSHRDGV